MFGNSTRLDVTLICGITDMRKSIDGLSNIVAYELQQEPCNEHLFVFCNPGADHTRSFFIHSLYKQRDKK